MLKKLWGGLAVLGTIAAAPEAITLAICGAAVNAIGDAVKKSGKEEGYTDGYHAASTEYEAKLKAQAEAFKIEKDELLAAARTSIAKRDELINECNKRIQELENENGMLKDMSYSEKQEYLDFYYDFKNQLEAA